MPATIRDATEADLTAILAIYNEAIRASTAVYTDQEASLTDRQAWFAQRAGQGYPVLVATYPADGAVLGFASFGDFRPWPGYRLTVEHSVYIRADRRGRGLGRSSMARPGRGGRVEAGPPPAPARAGHNGGPSLDEPDPDASWRLWCWRRAHRTAWSAPREIALRRLARAEELGMTYRAYTLEILERGRYL